MLQKRVFKRSVSSLLCCLGLAVSISTASGQAFFGVKAGVNANKAYFDSEVYKKFYSSEHVLGYTGGITFLYENKEKYGFYTEILYSTKGKEIKSSANNYLSNSAVYQYIDVPLMFRIKFKRSSLDWYLQLGPEVSYWLGGKGTFQVYESDRDQVVTYDYQVNFGEPKSSTEYLNVQESNRIQLGLTFGGGCVWKLDNANYVGIDVRYSLGHTYNGSFEGADMPNIGLVDNLEYTNNLLAVTATYFFDILEKNRLSKNKYRKK